MALFRAIDASLVSRLFPSTFCSQVAFLQTVEKIDSIFLLSFDRKLYIWKLLPLLGPTFFNF